MNLAKNSMNFYTSILLVIALVLEKGEAEVMCWTLILVVDWACSMDLPPHYVALNSGQVSVFQVSVFQC